MKNIKWRSVLAAALMFLLIIPATIFAASNENNRNDRGNQSYKLQVLKSAEVGNYLADNKGMTLYHFTKDTPGVSNCSGKCVEIWPPFYAENIKATEGFHKKDFGTIIREDGQKQTTYKGYPLYYFVKDLQAGDTKGQGVNNIWYVVGKHFMKDSE